MSSDNDGLMCGNAAQFYAYLCACKTEPRTVEQAQALKATLQQIKATYNNYGAYCKGIGKITDVIPDCKVGRAENGSGDVAGTGKITELKVIGNTTLSILNALAASSNNAKLISTVNELNQNHADFDQIRNAINSNGLGDRSNAESMNLMESVSDILAIGTSIFDNRTAAEKHVNELERAVNRSPMDEEAALKLGYYHRDGKYVEQSNVMALMYFRLCIDAYPSLNYDMAIIYLESTGSYTSSIGIYNDTALSFLRKALRHGDMRAAFILAQLYERGDVLVRDLDKACYLHHLITKTADIVPERSASFLNQNSRNCSSISDLALLEIRNGSLNENLHAGDIEICQELIEKGAGVTNIDAESNTALHLFLKMYNPLLNRPFLDALIDAGASFNDVNEKGETPFHLFAEYNSEADPEVWEFLLNEGANPNTAALNSSTPFHRFSESEGYSQREVWKLLLEHGGNPKINNRSGSDVLTLYLYECIYEGEDPDQAIIQLLNGAGLDLNDPKYLYDLLSFIGDTVTLKRLIELGLSTDFNQVIPSRQYTPFHRFAENAEADLELWRYLLENGADPNNLQGVIPSTPFHFFAGNFWKNEQIVFWKLMLDYGADPAVKDDGGRNVLHVYLDYVSVHKAGKPNMEIVKLLENEGVNMNLSKYQVQHATDTMTLNKLIADGVTSLTFDQTPLPTYLSEPAISLEKMKELRDILLVLYRHHVIAEEGMYHRLVNSWELKRDDASRKNILWLIDELLKHGIQFTDTDWLMFHTEMDVNLKNVFAKYGYDRKNMEAPKAEGINASLGHAFLEPIRKNDFAAVKKLVEEGADINAVNGYQHTALTFAVINGNQNIVNYLLSEGADPNKGDVLANGIGYGRMENFDIDILKAIVKTLIDNGADPYLKSSRGFTPLEIAVFANADFLVDALLSAGVNPASGDVIANSVNELAGESDPGKLEKAKKIKALLIEYGADPAQWD